MWPPVLSHTLTSDSRSPDLCPLSSEYLVELREYGPIYSSWAGSEDELQEPLEGVAGSVATDRKSVGEGESVDLGGRRII